MSKIQSKVWSGMAAASLAGVLMAFAASTSFCTDTPLAAGVASAQPPTIHAGDTWTDQLSSGDKDYKVASVNSDGVSFTQWGAEMQSDSQWNPIVTRSFTEDESPPQNYEKPLLLFPFPLTPGKTWTAESKWKIPDIQQAGRSDVDGKVGDWEQVTVPAGTYRALKVDVTIRLIGRLGFNNTTTITYWYVPEVNRYVKFHYQDESQGIVDAAMVSYTPVKQ
ncbi:MAG: hypothetical protein ACLQDV_01255 [Candidatus Binataceae bacterium]